MVTDPRFGADQEVFRIGSERSRKICSVPHLWSTIATVEGNILEVQKSTSKAWRSCRIMHSVQTGDKIGHRRANLYSTILGAIQNASSNARDRDGFPQARNSATKYKPLQLTIINGAQM
jgi:hypothetical protein